MTEQPPTPLRKDLAEEMADQLIGELPVSAVERAEIEYMLMVHHEQLRGKSLFPWRKPTFAVKRSSAGVEFIITWTMPHMGMME